MLFVKLDSYTYNYYIVLYNLYIDPFLHPYGRFSRDVRYQARLPLPLSLVYVEKRSESLGTKLVSVWVHAGFFFNLALIPGLRSNDLLMNIVYIMWEWAYPSYWWLPPTPLAIVRAESVCMRSGFDPPTKEVGCTIVLALMSLCVFWCCRGRAVLAMFVDGL